MTFIQARGPRRESTSIPSSAFSKGDLLMYTSNSSLSRLPDPITADGNIVGVALASSLESLNNQVPIALAIPGSIWISTATTGSQFTAGEKLDVEYTGAVFRTSTSANTPVVIISADGGSVDQVDSAVSRVMVEFDQNATIWGS